MRSRPTCQWVLTTKTTCTIAIAVTLQSIINQLATKLLHYNMTGLVDAVRRYESHTLYGTCGVARSSICVYAHTHTHTHDGVSNPADSSRWQTTSFMLTCMRNPGRHIVLKVPITAWIGVFNLVFWSCFLCCICKSQRRRARAGRAAYTGFGGVSTTTSIRQEGTYEYKCGTVWGR